jgi:hypothetical protein
MLQDLALGVNAQKAHGPMLRHADGPEEGLRGASRALDPFLFLHAPHEDQEPFSSVRSRGDGLFQKILLAPERLAPVDHGLRLGAHAEEEYRRGEDDPVGFADRLVDPGHGVVHDANAGHHAAAAVLTGPDVHHIQLEGHDLVTRLPDGLERLLDQEVGVPLNSGAAVKCHDFHGVFLFLR